MELIVTPKAKVYYALNTSQTFHAYCWRKSLKNPNIATYSFTTIVNHVPQHCESFIFKKQGSLYKVYCYELKQFLWLPASRLKRVDYYG